MCPGPSKLVLLNPDLTAEATIVPGFLSYICAVRSNDRALFYGFITQTAKSFVSPGSIVVELLNETMAKYVAFEPPPKL